MLWVVNFIAYSLQIAVLLSVAAVAFRLLPIRPPAWRLLVWQTVLAACLALPILQPWQTVRSGVSIEISSRAATSTVSSVPVRRAPSLPGVLGGVLLAGVVIRLALFGLGLFRLTNLRRKSRPQPGLAALLYARLGIRAELATCAGILGPVTFGCFRPVVLIPDKWLQCESVLYHEFIHVRRRDWLFMAAEELIRALFWFHPLVWYAIAQIQLAREEVVDREVIGLTRSREQYLETLLAIAAARSGLDLAPAPLFLRRRHLRKRIHSLMKEVPMSRARLHASIAGFAALALISGWLAIRSFPLQAAQADAQDRSQSSTALPKLVYKTPVEYPADLRGSGLKGVVAVRIVVDKDGLVSDAHVLSGMAKFREAALDSIRQWRFSTDAKLPAEADVEVHFSDSDTAAVLGADTPTSDRIRIGGNALATHILHKVVPIYPVESKAAHIQGKVRFTIVVTKEGTVKDLQVVEGDPVLAQAAMYAVNQWTYQPTLLNGEPVEVISQVDVNFTLTH